MKSITILFLALSLGLAGCKSAQTFPQPTADEGQVLVTLTGVPKTGVTGPKSESTDIYSNSEMSVERGKRFERVDYDEIENVVVILERVDGEGLVSNGGFSFGNIEILIDDDGFMHGQYSIVDGDRNAVEIHNKTGDAINVFGINEKDASFSFSIPKGKYKSLEPSFFDNPNHGGKWTISIDEMADVMGDITVVNGLSWVGSSDEGAFFGNLEAGEYIVRVIAPRLPEVTKTLTVTKGKRSTVAVKLTVNGLPRVK